MTHTLTLEGFHVPLLNSVRNKHWSAEYRAKKQTAKRLTMEAIVQRVPVASGKRKVRLTMHGWYSGTLPDRDAPLKIFLDALVRAGLLTDDGASGLEGQALVEFVRSKEKRTVITLEDC